LRHLNGRQGISEGLTKDLHNGGKRKGVSRKKEPEFKQGEKQGGGNYGPDLSKKEYQAKASQEQSEIEKTPGQRQEIGGDGFYQIDVGEKKREKRTRRTFEEKKKKQPEEEDRLAPSGVFTEVATR